MVPSCSVRVTRRASCSQDTSRPWRSRVLPLVLFDGLRKTLTAPVSSSHFMTRLFGISLQSRKRPSPNHTGPSAHRKPVARRSTAASASRYGAKLGSRTWTAGSGYRTGLLGQRSMRLLSVRGWISTARSLTGERHETSVERAARAVPRAPRRSGAGQRTGRRPGAQARRNPQCDAGRRPAGVFDPRVVDDLRILRKNVRWHEKELKALPGYRAAAQDKAEARRLLASAGVAPGTPLKVDLVTRNFAIYVDLASFVVDQLKQIGVEATLRQVDTAAWFPTLARREFQIGANLTAGVVDDPDAYFFENYKCGSPRNYTDYCDEQVDRLIDAQSQELDRARRQRLAGGSNASSRP